MRRVSVCLHVLLFIRMLIAHDLCDINASYGHHSEYTLLYTCFACAEEYCFCHRRQMQGSKCCWSAPVCPTVTPLHWEERPCIRNNGLCSQWAILFTPRTLNRYLPSIPCSNGPFRLTILICHRFWDHLYAFLELTRILATHIWYTNYGFVIWFHENSFKLYGSFVFISGNMEKKQTCSENSK